MTEKERLQRERELKQEIYQLDMKILDFELGEAGAPIDLEKFKARRAELQKQVAELA